ARELGMGGAGLVLLVNAAVLVAMRVLGRRLPDRVGPRRAAAAGVLLAASGIGLAAALPSPAGPPFRAARFRPGHPPPPSPPRLATRRSSSSRSGVRRRTGGAPRWAASRRSGGSASRSVRPSSDSWPPSGGTASRTPPERRSPPQA